nr:immunoglobulin light chain junction region [Macaca mulatta]MOW53123.1 immunoglobulin light chain junction region [Macaca mulatta]MOW53446.1 immunoglobulin light chain junction region [Macaca mulatta]MOW54248.1 immunoglobulin light chain junction region [Macaca mulatta]MOW54390.1 immunoglobulin light chain junction region [Macaca mulatta]
CLQGDSTPYTF